MKTLITKLMITGLVAMTASLAITASAHAETIKSSAESIEPSSIDQLIRLVNKDNPGSSPPTLKSLTKHFIF